MTTNQTIINAPDTCHDYRFRRHWVGRGRFREVQSVSITYARITSTGKVVRETLTTLPNENAAVEWLSAYLTARAIK